MEAQKANGQEVVTNTELLPPAEAKALARSFIGEKEETAEQLLARANKTIAVHEGIVKLIASKINPKAIHLFGENIWLTDEACLRVLGWIGANISVGIRESLRKQRSCFQRHGLDEWHGDRQWEWFHLVR